MSERSDAPLADEPQPGAIPNDVPEDVPSGLPEGAPESDPLGPPETRPDEQGERGSGTMPGIPTEGEPPTAG